MPLLLGWLQLQQRPAVQVEALWALTNIAAGTAEHTHVLIKHGAVPTLVSLLSSPNEEVLEQAMWVLGNLAGEGATARDAVLGSGALGPLVNVSDVNGSAVLCSVGGPALDAIRNVTCSHCVAYALTLSIHLPAATIASAYHVQRARSRCFGSAPGPYRTSVMDR